MTSEKYLDIYLQKVICYIYYSIWMAFYSDYFLLSGYMQGFGKTETKHWLCVLYK